ncbi:hypothetical protein DFH06DRAFT_1139924 [Mycena polygramma]|nr:hypothetical protein DFH06DRAFT_1139924 [Mycena polygramma]
MYPLQPLLFALFAALLVCAAPSADKRDLIGGIIDALGIGLVKQINVTLTLATLTTNLVTALPFELTIDRVSATAGLNGTVYAKFEHQFARSVVLRPLQQANSGNITNVLLTKGATASLGIIPAGFLDLLNVDVDLRALSFQGIGGVPLVISDLHQTGVPTTIPTKYNVLCQFSLCVEAPVRKKCPGKTFHDPALDVLWYHQNTLMNLILCIPAGLWIRKSLDVSGRNLMNLVRNSFLEDMLVGHRLTVGPTSEPFPGPCAFRLGSASRDTPPFYSLRWQSYILRIVQIDVEDANVTQLTGFLRTWNDPPLRLFNLEDLYSVLGSHISPDDLLLLKLELFHFTPIGQSRHPDHLFRHLFTFTNLVALSIHVPSGSDQLDRLVFQDDQFGPAMAAYSTFSSLYRIQFFHPNGGLLLILHTVIKIKGGGR